MAKILLDIPDELLIYIDRQAKGYFITRSEYLRTMIRIEVMENESLQNSKKYGKRRRKI